MHVRQAVITGQNQVEFKEYDIDPDALGATQVLIETERTFISAGTELANYTGLDPKVFKPGNWNTYPWTPGYANIGHVRAMGDAVTRVGLGDRVYTFGRHASAHIWDTENVCITVPKGVDSDIAAASRMADVAITSVHIAELGFNRWVVVFGLGMVGNLAAQMFQLHGCRVIGVDPSPKRRAMAESCGIKHTLGGTPEEIKAGIAEITGGAMAATTVDAVGDSRVCMQALDNTAAHGELIILGTPRATVEGNLTKVFETCHLKWITIKGGLEWRLPQYPNIEYQRSHAGKHAMIFEWIADGRLQVAPLISHRLPAEQIKVAYEGLLNEKDTYLGVVLQWT